MDINIDLSEIYSVINPSFHWLMTDKHRNLVLRGGAGSGKSYSVAQVLLYHILSTLDQPAPHRFLVLRKTSPATRKSVFPLFQHLIKEWNIEKLVSVNSTHGVFSFINGSQILISGLDDEEKVKSLFGVDKIWLEEANEFTLNDFRQLSLRLRGDTGKNYQVIMTFNPVSSFSWLHDTFYKVDRPNTILHLSTYKNNNYLDEEYKNQLEDLVNQDENYASIYLRGEWGFLEKTIYDNWSIIEEYPDTLLEEVYGLDFGFTHPTALIRCGISEEGIYLKEEIYQSGMTTPDLIEKLKVVVKNNARIYADSALPGVIQEIRLAGFNIRGANKKPYSVIEGITYIKRHKLFVTKDSTNMISEFNSYSFKSDKDGTTREEPIKFHDDAMDALRYGIYTHMHNRANYEIIVPD